MGPTIGQRAPTQASNSGHVGKSRFPVATLTLTRSLNPPRFKFEPHQARHGRSAQELRKPVATAPGWVPSARTCGTLTHTATRRLV
jgi:hypothetical protein